MATTHTHFVLTGFKQDSGYRVFAFDGIAEDRSRTAFVVRADLSLIRGYGIHVQDLPLLCRGLLEREIDGQQSRALTYSEEDMRLFAQNSAATAAARKRSTPPRRPPPSQSVDGGWRTAQAIAE